MASQLTLILWSDHPADPSLASDLAAQAAAQIFRSSSQHAAVVSATSVDIAVHDIEAAVAAFAEAEVPQVAPPAPVVVDPPADASPDNAPPAVVPEPQPTNADGTPIPAPDVAVPEGTTAASAGLVSAPISDPATQVVDSDEHLAVLVQLFEALTPEQKAELDAEVTTLEDAHAALERIYAPLVEAEATVDPPVA